MKRLIAILLVLLLTSGANAQQRMICEGGSCRLVNTTRVAVSRPAVVQSSRVTVKAKAQTTRSMLFPRWRRFARRFFGR